MGVFSSTAGRVKCDCWSLPHREISRDPSPQITGEKVIDFPKGSQITVKNYFIKIAAVIAEESQLIIGIDKER